MGMIRSYAEEQGDPVRVSMRAGRLVRRRALPARAAFGRQRAARWQGDPWGFKLGGWLKRATKPPKAVRKLTWAKVGKAVGSAVKYAAPLASFIPGVGAIAAPVLGALAGGGGPDNPAPELVQQMPWEGTVGMRARVDESGYPVLPVEYPVEAVAEYPDAYEYEDEPEDEDEELYTEEDY